jgi:hypothetical protein
VNAAGSAAPSPSTRRRSGESRTSAILSRFFGWALIAGLAVDALAPQHRAMRRRFMAALGIACALYVPFLLADAAHGWANLGFTFHGKHGFHGFASAAFADPANVRFAAYALLFWIVGYIVAVRPRIGLIAWTALPLPTALAVLALFDRVESYWLLGPFASLCVGIGIALVRLSPLRRRVLGLGAALPAAFTLATVLFAALDGPAQASVLHVLGSGAKGPLYSSVYMFRPLAEEIRTMTHARSATALTDRLEIAAELGYYGAPASMIGEAPQIAQWNRWFDAGAAVWPRALVVTFTPLESDERLSTRVHRAYAHVEPSVAHRYDFAGTTAGTFYVTWCDAPRAGASRP